MKDLHARTIKAGVRGFVVLAILVFLPAGTLRFWQGWAFLATFTVCSTALTVYMALYDEKLLERRLRAGPRAETESSQKIIMALVMLDSPRSCRSLCLIIDSVGRRCRHMSRSSETD